MEADSEQLQLKRLLVDLEDEHEHLQGTVDHLQKEIDKREIEIKKLLADRELQLARDGFQKDINLRKSQSCLDFKTTNPANNLQKGEEDYPQNLESQEYSSEFVEQVRQLLDRITKTSEQVSTLIKF